MSTGDDRIPNPYRTAAPQEGKTMAIDWKAKKAAAEAELAAAKAALTEDDLTELSERAAVDSVLAETAQVRRDAREISLARRFDVQREKLGPDAQISPVSIDGRDDTFVIQHDSKAHAKWESDLAATQTNKKLHKEEVNRTYALSLVIDWNGIIDFGIGNLNGHALNEHLKRNSGMTTPIINEGARLAGFFAEARKR